MYRLTCSSKNSNPNHLFIIVSSDKDHLAETCLDHRFASIFVWKGFYVLSFVKYELGRGTNKLEEGTYDWSGMYWEGRCMVKTFRLASALLPFPDFCKACGPLGYQHQGIDIVKISRFLCP